MAKRMDINHFDEYSTDLPKKHKKKNGAAVAVSVVLGIAVLILLGIIAFFLFCDRLDIPFLSAEEETTAEVTTEAVTTEPTTEAPTEEPTFDVPNVVGMNANDAYEKLNSVGVKYTVTREFSDTVAIDYVISQSPQDGTVKKSEKVLLYISKGTDTPPATSANPKETNPKTTNSDKKQNSSQASGSDSGYVLDGSNKRYVERSEVTKLSAQEMEIALNEIYARHGRRFKSSQLQVYFDAQSWYNGTTAPEHFNESVLNQYEQANIALIVSVMEEKGYR